MQLSFEVTKVVEAILNEEPITLYTSGTTGEPKRVVKQVRVSYQGNMLLTYSPTRWAGVSVILYAINNNMRLIVPHSLTPEHIFKAGIEQKATHVSLTPSLFKKMAMLGYIIPTLKQITFGGEAARQSVLDLAKRLYPKARISHVYASTEHGDICCVSDGLAGIPKDKLEKKDFNNDDIWEQRGDRYYFVGREGSVINVGGNKVHPETVEEAAGVECRAYAIPSPILGSVVGLEYVSDLPEGVFEHLPKYARPMKLTKVDAIEYTDAGKIKR